VAVLDRPQADKGLRAASSCSGRRLGGWLLLGAVVVAALAGGLDVLPFPGTGDASPKSQSGLVWFEPVPAGTSAGAFDEQSYQGRPVLTLWRGDRTPHQCRLSECTQGNRRPRANVERDG
jgi:hypothetical protein